MRNMNSWVLLLVILIITGCSGGGNNNDDNVETNTTVSENFESGSIGIVNKISDSDWELSLADDNDNNDLPDRWRNWWYVKMNSLSIQSPTSITLKNRGWSYYYLPVYSYDQKEWFRFTENEVSQNENDELIIEKLFQNETAWIARFYPYTYSDLNSYLDTINDSIYVNINTQGLSQEGNSVPLISITDFDVSVSEKKRIWMHARTHPAETCPSFLLEGFINFLLTDTQETSKILSEFEFHIIPMQNVDGVIAGNYRTTTQSENLEVMWYHDSTNPENLNENVPQEITTLHQAITNLFNDGGPPVTMALNLHASNSEPDIRPFFYPHYGPESLDYSATESSLWNKQLRFINSFASYYGTNMIEPVGDEGGSSFATKTYPESWWWNNFQDQVMAITIETTYGRSGYSPDWIEPDDLRSAGMSLARGIRDYYDDSVSFEKTISEFNQNVRRSSIKYPELYPPTAEDEMKE